MRLRPRLAIIALMALLSVRAAAGDPVSPHFYVGPYFGYTVFDGKLRFPSQTLRDYLNLGGRVGYQWSDWLGVEGLAGFTPTEEEVPTGPRSVRFGHASGALVLSHYGSVFGAPFLMLGAGANRLQARSGIDSTLTRGHLDFGAGLRFWVSDQIALRVEAHDLYSLEKTATGVRDQTLIFGVSAVYAFGARPRDTDQDKVPDRHDDHLATPKGAVVSARGVPVDSDGDGVFDGIDRGANTPKGATIDAFGVAGDSDGDGVYDGLDSCAATPRGASVDAKGCPSDSDQDGVFDGVDQCASTPQGFPVDERGCPKDQDKDGVADDRDKCPDTAAGATVDSSGCVPVGAEIKSELERTGKIVLELGSMSGKALPADARARLDQIGPVLTQLPDLRIEIAGHTDTRGSASANTRLSEERARAVRNYLVQNFPEIKPERFTVKGHGESKPLVKETSPETLAKNRRVEFVVLNPDALKGATPGTP
jgi:outer membrane protein OmpA-like peptidoglycan-associated protein